MLTRRAALAGLGAIGLAACDGGPKRIGPKRSIQLKAYPITSFQPGSPETRFGALEFLSGVELESEDPWFGGLSALRINPDGSRFLSVNDQGLWFTGEIIKDRGRIIAIANGQLAPILDQVGRPLASLFEHDTESLALMGDIAFVGVEYDNKIYRFDLAAGGVDARGTAMSLPPDMARLHPLFGLESLGIMPVQSAWPGALIAIAEDDPDDSGRIPGWVLPTNGDVQRFFIEKTERFRVTDMDFLPDGTLVLLERSQSIREPVRIRLRHVPLQDIRNTKLIKGVELFMATQPAQIDNLEGVSINASPAGDIILTTVSDSNFSILQRTLLLQWKLILPMSG